MKNLQTVIEKVQGLDLKEANGKINQTVRNTIKAELVEALVNDLKDLGALRVKDGVALPIESTTKRNLITVTIDPVIKNLDFDPDFEAEAYADAQAEKQAEAEKKAKAKAEKLAKNKKAE